MSEADPKATGPFASLRRICDSLLALAQSRLQLFALELQGEKLRLVDTLLWLGAGLAFGGLGLLLGAAALALYLWETARFAGLLAMTGVLVGAAAVILWRLRARGCDPGQCRLRTPSLSSKRTAHVGESKTKRVGRRQAPGGAAIGHPPRAASA
jgi:uncharacterized membrane protein YqjE